MQRQAGNASAHRASAGIEQSTHLTSTLMQAYGIVTCHRPRFSTHLFGYCRLTLPTLWPIGLGAVIGLASLQAHLVSVCTDACATWIGSLC